MTREPTVRSGLPTRELRARAKWRFIRKAWQRYQLHCDPGALRELSEAIDRWRPRRVEIREPVEVVDYEITGWAENRSVRLRSVSTSAGNESASQRRLALAARRLPLRRSNLRGAYVAARRARGLDVEVPVGPRETRTGLLQRPTLLGACVKHAFRFTVQVPMPPGSEVVLLVEDAAGRPLTVAWSVDLWERAIFSNMASPFGNSYNVGEVTSLVPLAPAGRDRTPDDWLDVGLNQSVATVARIVAELGDLSLAREASGRLVSPVHRALFAFVANEGGQVGPAGTMVVRTAPLPKVNAESAHPRETPRAVEVKDVSLLHGRFLVHGDRWLTTDDAVDPRYGTVAGNGLAAWGSAAMGDRALLLSANEPQTLSSGVVLAGRADPNWFHWIVETLSFGTYALDAAPPDYPIVMRSDLPKSAYELLHLVSPRRLLTFPEFSNVQIDHAVVAPVVSSALDTPWAGPLRGSFDRDSLMRLRHLAGSAVGRSRHIPARSLFITRKNTYRSLRNSEELHRVLEDLGYEAIDPSRMSAVEQVLLFGSAERLVLQGGAAMANLVFCAPGTQVTVICADSFGQGRYWTRLCDALDLECVTVEGAVSSRTPISRRLHADFSVSGEQLRRALMLHTSR